MKCGKALIAYCALFVALSPGIVHAVTVMGTVTDALGTTIARVQLDFVDAATQQTAGATSTATDGTYQLTVPAGTYDVHVTPPAGSGFLPQTLPGRSIQSDTTLDIVLVSSTETVTYGGTLTDRDATPVSGVAIALCIPPMGTGCVTGFSDAQGVFAVQVLPGTYDVRISRGIFGNPTLPGSFGLAVGTRVLASDFDEGTVVLENRIVTGTVVDVGGNPVPNVSLQVSLSAAFGTLAGSAQDVAVTDAAGDFTLVVFPGTGSILATPPQGSGLGPASAPITVTGDLSGVLIALPAAVTYGGTLTDRDATPVSGVAIALCIPPMGTGCVTGFSDAQGVFAVQVLPGTYDVRISRGIFGNPTLPGSFGLAVGTRVLASDFDEGTVVLENRIVTGTVVDADGNPVPNVSLQVSLSAAFGTLAGSAQDVAVTDAAGDFTLVVFPGTGSILATPPQGSGLGPASAPITVTGDLSGVLIALPAAVTYGGTLTDRDATPVSGVAIALCIPPMGTGCVTGFSDAQGVFAVQVLPGTYDVRISRGIFGNPTLPGSFGLAVGTRVLASDFDEGTVVLENRIVTGTVVDADGNPVPNVSLQVSLSAAFGSLAGSAQDVAVTDATGDFRLILFPGTGSILATPAAGSGFGSFSIQGLSVTGDSTLGILLQFLTDSASMTVGSGGSVTTDDENDGATATDPVETAVTSPNAGLVTINEAPITLVPPGGFRFLTQQVNITAPPATAANPLVIVFQLDASRFPPGQATTIRVFKDGVLVGPCVGAPGVAAPDPCVASQIELPDGDASITVLTSTASGWNLGLELETTTTTTTVTTTTSTTSSTTTLSTTTTSTSTTTSSSSTSTSSSATTSSTVGTASTTTTTLLGDCASVPVAPTFPSITCRLDALLAVVEDERALRRLRQTLAFSLEKAAARTQAARVYCADADRFRATVRLLQARRALALFIRLLRGVPARRTAPAELVETLESAAQDVRDDLEALRRVLDCPEMIQGDG